MQKNFTENELRESYWLLSHAAQFRRWALRSIVGIEAFIIVMFLVQFFGYLFYAFTREITIVQPLRAYAAFVYPTLTLENPSIILSGMIDRGTGLTDLYALVQNTQADWRADFDVIFSINGTDQQTVRAFAFPGDRKYILKLGIAQNSGAQATARIERVQWQKISPSQRAILSKSRKTRISGFDLSTGRTAGGSILYGTRVRFTIENESVYNLYDFQIPVIIKSGATPIAVTLVPVLSLSRNQILPLEARWDYSFAGTEYEIVPTVDVLDSTHARPAF